MKRSRSRDPRNHGDDDPPIDHGHDPLNHGDDDQPWDEDDYDNYGNHHIPSHPGYSVPCSNHVDEEYHPDPLRSFQIPASTLEKTRDAVVSFAAGHGVLQVPISRRVRQFLRTERLFVTGGYEISLRYPNSPFNDQRQDHLVGCFSTSVLIFEGEITSCWEKDFCLMHEIRDHFGIAVLRGDIWAVGGANSYSDALKSCERLHAGSSEWSLGPEMSTARKMLAVAVLDDEVWAIGGATVLAIGGSTVLSSCERLTVGGVWTPGPAMTAPRCFHQAAVRDGVLWVVDGDSRETEYYDAPTNQWVRGPLLVQAERV